MLCHSIREQITFSQYAIKRHEMSFPTMYTFFLKYDNKN